MPNLISREKAVPRFAKLLSALALLLWVPLAAAQNNLGALLDAGGKVLSPEEFKQELVQRVIVGLTATGGSIEIMYADNGTIQGTGTAPIAPGNRFASLNGEWKTDDSGKICTSMRIGGVPGVILPFRCQFWFKYKADYFISDSDSDRSTRILRRTLKQ